MGFWSFIGSLPLWFQILFAVMILVIFIFMVFKGIEIKRGRIRIKINKKDGVKKDKISPHENCQYAPEVLVNFSELDKLKFEKWTVIYLDQLRDQMNYARQKCEQIRVLLQQKYISLLESKKISEIISSDSFCIYQLILRVGTEELLEIIRDSFRENHFDSMDEKQFSIYVCPVLV